MNRRDLLQAAGIAAAAGLAQTALAQDHSQHHGAGHDAMVRTASDCVSTGEVCLTHCHEMLATGDKSLGQCAKSVDELIAVCSALRSVAAQNAPSLAKLAAVTVDVCTRCEAECRKHEKAHAQCKACADACKACAAECKKMA